MKAFELLFVGIAASAQVNFYSLEQEQQLGEKLAQRMAMQTTPTSQENARDYVQRLGQRIASQIWATPNAAGRYFYAQYRFAVIKEDSQDTGGTHEPVVLPGGYIFVSERLILAAHNEAEFAGMLAHAIAHTAARHATRMLTRGRIAELSGRRADPDPTSPDAVARLVNVQSASMLAFSRDFEKEADATGASAAAWAGFDPLAFARYIERTQVDAKAIVFSGIPRRAARVAAIENLAEGLPSAGSTDSSAEFLKIQRELQ